ncbi:MAG TPA: phosphatidylserine/phosphatidylglycerophosphate/cardiolipin synthase family protein [Thermoanaerobaculia bacterium]
MLALVLAVLLAATARADVVRILDKDQEAAQARVDLIREAHDRIEVLYFIAKDDRVSAAMLQLLRDARRRGVSVRMVIDGSFRRIPKGILTHLRDEGVVVRTYHPFDLRHPTWIDHRMHDKLIVVDGKRYITGGRNLDESYFGLSPKINYRDIDIYVDGASAADAEQRFEQVWSSRDVANLHGHVTRRAKRDAAEHLGDSLEAMVKSKFIDLGPARNWSEGALKDGPVRFIAGHGIGGEMTPLLTAAKESIVIESPYFIPPQFLRDLLLKKLAEGVRITVVTNSVRSTDGLLPQVGYLKYRGTLAHAGIDFHEYKGPDCLHGKVIIIDGRV